MTPSVALAAVAGALAGLALTELAVAWPRGRPVRRDRQALGPLFSLLRLAGRPLARAAPAGAGDRLAAAGLNVAVPDFAAAKAGGALAAALAAATNLPSLPGRLAWLAVAGAALGGFTLPDLLVARRARRRGAAIEAALADVADLLRVAAAAGLPPMRALAEIGRRHRSLLAAEVGACARRRALGVPPVAALDELARRAPGAGALVAALARAERHGAPLDGALAAIADDARARRARSASERAARAAPKIQLVVALVLVPSVLALMAAALVPALS